MSPTWYDIFCDRCIAKLEKKFGMSIDDAYDTGKLSFSKDDLCLPWVRYQITGDIGKMCYAPNTTICFPSIQRRCMIQTSIAARLEY